MPARGRVGVEAQPLKAQVRRVAEALEYLGEPLSADDKRVLERAAAIMNEDEATEAIQKVLDMDKAYVGVRERIAAEKNKDGGKAKP